MSSRPEEQGRICYQACKMFLVILLLCILGTGWNTVQNRKSGSSWISCKLFEVQRAPLTLPHSVVILQRVCKSKLKSAYRCNCFQDFSLLFFLVWLHKAGSHNCFEWNSSQSHCWNQRRTNVWGKRLFCKSGLLKGADILHSDAAWLAVAVILLYHLKEYKTIRSSSKNKTS